MLILLQMERKAFNIYILQTVQKTLLTMTILI